MSVGMFYSSILGCKRIIELKFSSENFSLIFDKHLKTRQTRLVITTVECTLHVLYRPLSPVPKNIIKHKMPLDVRLLSRKRICKQRYIGKTAVFL